MSDRALPPVLVLISDGQPTDDFGKGLEDLLGQPWGKKAVRVAIAIGDDADLEVLRASSPTRRSTPCRPTTPRPWCATSGGSLPPCCAASSPASQVARQERARLGALGASTSGGRSSRLRVAPFRALRHPGRRCPPPGAGRDGERRGRGRQHGHASADVW